MTTTKGSDLGAIDEGLAVDDVGGEAVQGLCRVVGRHAGIESVVPTRWVMDGQSPNLLIRFNHLVTSAHLRRQRTHER